MLITVFTPSYNRVTFLRRILECLCQQTFKDFEWIVVDDGSTDSTKDMMDKIIAGCESFPIRYIYKENGGKHTAINLGTKLAKGELFFIVDSDDTLMDTALQTVADEWNKVKDNAQVGGVVGLDVNSKTGEIIGGGLPQDVIDCDAMEIRYRYHVRGDLKEVFKTEVLRAFPFPEIKGERFCPEQLVWFRIAQKYKLRYVNKPIYGAEYQPDGITSGIVKARMESPVATCMTYSEMLAYSIPVIQKIKAAINYWRFRCCVQTNTSQVPCVKCHWRIFRPMGYLMHIKDRKVIQ
ncbi:glycosyltransferase family 2 protein [Hoylesella buccalis]|uniref:Glycosyltransferase family 2 protein n=1 Tax=Hoylesella buccalis TaxID=28127 RepID=A0A2N6QRA1_9BACT|nr:glycosyltransferase family A protein [Hoylesella buccalis]PMC24374.1 glycosyltransferase family 2 protein [Hoylesella buccalis]